MKILAIILCSVFLGCVTTKAQDKSIAERLGYSADTKLLILHADDLGVAHSENAASISALETGPLNSASIMVPCSWFPEIVSYAHNHKDKDFGVHLTLTSEWKHYKWGPVSSQDSVSSLLTEDGYFYASVDSLQKYASPEEVEVELRNQVQKALRFGIEVTHLDAHMGAAYSSPEFTAAYMKVGKEYGVPVLIDYQVYNYDHEEVKIQLNDPNTIVVDSVLYMNQKAYLQHGARTFYTQTLKNLEPGLNFLLTHPAYDNTEMKAITVDHPNFGSAWRQDDYDFLTSKKCASLIEKYNIELVTWRELRDKITRAK